MPGDVLFLIPSLNFGGAEILLVQQVKWLQANGFKAFVAILSNQNDLRLLQQMDLPKENLLVLESTHSVLSFSALRYAIANRGSVVSFAEKCSVKNIVAHLPLAHFWGRLVKLSLPQTRLLVYHHSMQYQANPLNSLGKKAFNLMQLQLAKRTDDVSICVSRAVQDNIQQHFFLRNPVVLFNAVPEGSIHSLQHSPKEDTSVIKMILPGRLHPAKGHIFFLGVFAELTQHFTNLRLEIAGGGPLENAIQDFIAQNGLSEIVSVTGFLPNKDLVERINGAHLVVIPSLSEGLGIVAIEALMLGKTIVASDTGGLKEIIDQGRNGYLFEAGINSSCFNQLYAVLSQYPATLIDPVQQRADFERRFTFDTYIRKFVALLK